MPTDTLVRVDPATRFVRSLPGDYIMLREAAEMLEVTQFTLRKFIQDDVEGCVPSKYAMLGKIKIYLYTQEDVESIRDHLRDLTKVYDHVGQAKRIGRPPEYTQPERDKRSRLYSKSWYWKNRVRLLTERGDADGAAQAQQRVDEIQKELKK